MTKDIYVQARADHVASLASAAPLAAVEELIWNALDADAREVRVDLVTNPLGGIDAIRVTDDGTGIDILRADETFGSLGGSWKRADGATTAARHRRLHGRHGRGRFKTFALGGHVEWRTTMRAGGDLLSYTLSGDATEPGVFHVTPAEGTGPATGTEVFVTGVHANVESLSDATAAGVVISSGGFSSAHDTAVRAAMSTASARADSDTSFLFMSDFLLITNCVSI